MRARRAGVRFYREASRNMRSAPIRAASTDREVMPQGPVPRTPAKARAWTIAAPPPSPNSCGSARGLRVALWSSDPAAPRHAPATRAAKTLGMRSERTITSAVGSPLSVKRALRSVEASRLAVPKATPTTQPAKSATVRPVRTRVRDAAMGSLLSVRPSLPLPRLCADQDYGERLHDRPHASDHS